MGDENPYQSPTATTSRARGPKIKWTAKCLAYGYPALMAMGVMLYVFVYFVGPVTDIHVFPYNVLYGPVAFLLMMGMACFITGWGVAGFQLVLALVRRSQGDPIWKHHLAAVVLAIVCYLVFILLMSFGIVGGA